MQELLERYRDRLTDLSKRNTSLRLLRTTQKNHCDIASFSTVESELDSRIATDILSMKSEVSMLPVLAMTEDETILSRRLTYLKREIDLIEQETGTNVFHVAYGFLEGTLVEDFYIRSPLVLYPARLVKKMLRKSQYWTVELDEQDPPFINPTLTLALKRYLGVDLGSVMKEEDFEVPKQDVISFLIKLLHQFDVNVVNGEASSVINPLPILKSNDIPKERVSFRIEPYMIMGKFRQSTSTLIHDYESLLDNPPQEGLLYRLLNQTPSEDQLAEVEPEILNEVKEVETFFVLDTDVSQEAAVIASRDRDGLIVHGPPGTGKSQVIVNLIADRLARGQRVLLVCQKPVALEVVYNRMSAIGLQHHVARVYDFNRDKASVYAKVGSVLQREVPDDSGSFDRMSSEMHELEKRLNLVATSLHASREFGKTLRYLYSHALWDQNMIIDVTDVVSGMTFEDLQERLVDLRTVIELMEKFDAINYPWSERNSFARFSNRQHMELQELTSRLSHDTKLGQEIVNSSTFEYTPVYYLRNLGGLEALKKCVQILSGTNLFKHVHMFYTDEERELEHEDQVSRVKKLHADLSARLVRIKELAAPIETMSHSEAESWASKIDQFLEMQQKMTRFLSASWYGLKKEIRDHCVNHQVLFDGNAIRKYRSSIESFLEFEARRTDASKFAFFADAPALNEVHDWETWLRRKQHAIEFLELYVEGQSCFGDWVSDVVTKEDLDKLIQEDFVHKLQKATELATLTDRLHHGLQALKLFLKPDMVDGLVKEVDGGIYDVVTHQALANSVSDFDSLIRLDQLKEQLDGLNQTLVTRCQAKAPMDRTPSVVQQWSKIIENSFYHTWIDAIEAQDPHVSEVSTDMYSNYRRQYAKMLLEKRKKVPLFIDGRLARQSTMIQRAARTKLKSEAGKKRRLKPLRQIIGAFQEDVLTLLPCWLCTPDAVSAIFPPQNGMFDLVIFDEASQCPVENAIPAIYRGKQVVVAGDEKQLPPTNLFRVADEDDEEEIESLEYVDRTDRQATHLLEWGKPRMADQWLTWHYRSENDALITFSNYAFYGQRMQTAPAAHASTGKPIEFVRVHGRWINNQNRIEADLIVDKVVDTLSQVDDVPTLGVITFNAAQADLINDVLDERAQKDPEIQKLIENAKQRKDGDQFIGLFVKNIENVQGDERDIILFSVGYAPDEQGKMVSQFGSLSQDGGENRLNVAVTRARKKVFIVCSFEPSEWTRVDTYASRGPRLLKKYLEYGKAVSDGDEERIGQVLGSILDATAVQDIRGQAVYDSPFEEEVARAVRSLGYTVHTQVGFSGYRIDLAVVHPKNLERYILAIECDGAMYHSSKIARERDFYRQRFLQQHGWRVHRVWSRNWWKAKHIEIEKIQEEIATVLGRHDVYDLQTSSTRDRTVSGV